MTIRAAGVLAANLLFILIQASACARVKSEPLRAEPAAPRDEQQTPAVPPPVEQSQAKPAEPPPKVTVKPPTTTEQPKPAEPPQSKAAPPSQPTRPAPAPPKPPEPPRPSQKAAPPSGQEQAAIVDLTSLEQRLRDTHAIGVFTKLALKNEVDDLLERLRAFHAGRGGALAKLRENFDLLVLKVVSLLQDKDTQLARDISTSREALWNLLADPVKFKTLGFNGGEDEPPHAGFGRDSLDHRLGRPTRTGRG